MAERVRPDIQVGDWVRYDSIDGYEKIEVVERVEGEYTVVADEWISPQNIKEVRRG